jgi:dienelactone hydrolase
MGLIWSASLQVPPESLAGLGIEPFAITFDAVAAGNVLTSTRVVRVQVADGVRREVVRANGLFGTLFVPPNDGPHPAVMLVSGSEGGLSEGLASLFAVHGIAGFALAYFNYETLPKALVNVPLEYFETGIEFLRAHPMIDGARLAVAGASRGGELSLLLGSMFSQLKAVVGWVPSGVVWGGFGDAREAGVQPAWVLNGRPVPFMDGAIHPDDYGYVTDYYRRGRGIPTTPGFLAQMNRYPDRVRQATIPVERINGAVLLISGEDDQMWPSTNMAEISVARLREHGFRDPYEHLSYVGAGHAFRVPYWPQTMIEMRHPVDGVLYAFGGNPESNAHAAVDSWRRVGHFLRENL